MPCRLYSAATVQRPPEMAFPARTLLPFDAVRIRVHPIFDPTYYGFYWEGFRRIGAQIELSTNGFPALDEAAFYSAKDCFAAIVDTNAGERRLVISADDHASVRPAALEWADRIGKVNLSSSQLSKGIDGLVPIGPSFGIRAWLLGESIDLARQARSLTGPSRRDRLYIEQFRKRLPETAYRPGRSDPAYVFFTAWPWTRHPEVNPPRAAFIRACRRQRGLRFEGGFAPRRRGNPSELAGLFAPKRYPLREYLDKLGRSAVVFNNPAVHGCLGWKLGEFLALGKAIVSLPIENVLPAPLEHGIHLHIVDGSPDALDEAIRRIREDDAYRRGLEQSAREYYDTWLSPEVVAGRLVAGWGEPSG